MAKLDKNKWLSSDTYEFREDSRGDSYAIKSQSTSLIKVIEDLMPNGSFTKFLRKKLKDKNLI